MRRPAAAHHPDRQQERPGGEPARHPRRGAQRGAELARAVRGDVGEDARPRGQGLLADLHRHQGAEGGAAADGGGGEWRRRRQEGDRRRCGFVLCILVIKTRIEISADMCNEYFVSIRFEY